MKHLFAFALPDAGLTPLALSEIRRSASDKDYLLTNREGLASDGPAVAFTGRGEDALARLRTRGQEMGARLVRQDGGRLFMVWRSPRIGFPNGAYAFVDDDGTVSLYGRALYGRRDFGANKAFIQAWATALAAR